MNIFQKIKFYLRLVLKQIIFIISRPYHILRNSWPIWYYIVNRKSRKLFYRHASTLDDIQKKVIHDLKTDGISVVHIEDFFPERELFEKLNIYKNSLLPKARDRKGKYFLKGLWDEIPELSFENPFVRFALNKKILNTVANYLGVWPRLRAFTLNLTIPVGVGGEAVSSQRWHRDPDDKKICKVFLYFSDVDENSGPFIYVKGSQYGGPFRNIFPQRPPKGIYPPKGAVEKRVSQEYILKGTGKAGTLIFCDTSGLHKGGHAFAKERIMFTAGYNTDASLWPDLYKKSPEFLQDLKKLPMMAQYAIKGKLE